MNAFIPRAAAVVVALVALCPVPAGAQPEPEVRLRLLGQPLWHSPGDDVGIAVAVENHGDEPIAGFYLRVAAHFRVENRTRLHESFQGEAGLEADLFTVEEFADRALEPGAIERVVIDEPLSSLESITGSADGGVYPLTITAIDSAFAELASLTTPVTYYPSRPDRPLNVVPVVPLAAAPARAPDGAFVADDDGRVPLAEAIAEGGWLDAMLDALERATDRRLRVGLAVSPLTIEELADMADGFTRASADLDGPVEVPPDAAPARTAAATLDRMRTLLRRVEVQTLLSPYALPDLPALAERPGAESIALQLTVGERALEAALDVVAERDWTLPPGGRIDGRALEQLQIADAAGTTFFAPGTLEETIGETGAIEGCPEASPTFACPIRVSTSVGSTVGYVADRGLQDRIGELVATGTVLTRQRMIAETAMIHVELPGTERVVAAIFPELWAPPSNVARASFAAFSAAPWLRTVRPDEGLALGDIPVRPRVLVDELDPPRGAPGDAYYDAIDAAREEVESFAAVNPLPELIDRLRKNLLVAESHLWWTADDSLTLGAAFADATRERAEAELAKIRIGVPNRVTLTSERGTIEVFVYNDASYPMTVEVQLDSPGLSFEAAERTLVIDPGGRRLTVAVTAETSGIFPLNVTVTTPEPAGRVIAAAGDISIRSTTFNRVALAITLGAVLFMVLFYAIRGWRRRVGRDENAEAAAT